MSKFIKIEQKYERLLPFMFPNISIKDDIIHKDISLNEKSSYDSRDCIVITNTNYDCIYDEETIKKKIQSLCKERYGKVKLLVIPRNVDFVDSCIKYMYMFDVDKGNEEIFALFNTMGTYKFTEEFLKLLTIEPLNKIISAMTTFIVNIVNSNSKYYLLKNRDIGSHIKRNYLQAVDEYNARPYDETGLSFIKFCNDLVK